MKKIAVVLLCACLWGVFTAAPSPAAANYDEGRAWFDRGDKDRGLNILTSLAGNGDVRSQLFLGHIYETGLRVEEDCAKAVQWYGRAAEQGNAEAQYRLGHIYEHGGAGVDRDLTAARKWYRKAAGHGHGQAMYNLGYMYEHGKGVYQSYEEAIKWYSAARGEIAEAGDAISKLSHGWETK